MSLEDNIYKEILKEQKRRIDKLYKDKKGNVDLFHIVYINNEVLREARNYIQSIKETVLT